MTHRPEATIKALKEEALLVKHDTGCLQHCGNHIRNVAAVGAGPPALAQMLQTEDAHAVELMVGHGRLELPVKLGPVLPSKGQELGQGLDGQLNVRQRGLDALSCSLVAGDAVVLQADEVFAGCSDQGNSTPLDSRLA